MTEQTHAPEGGAHPLRRRSLPSVVLVVVLLSLIGGTAIALPSALEWLAAGARSDAIGRYGETTTALTPEERATVLREAAFYNDRLTDSPLSDPFVPHPAGGMSSARGWEQYASQLLIDPSGPMARLRIARIDVDLPVYHGTDEVTLERGAGHLYGSSLPVGGTGTHAVVTAHNGYTGAEMFDRLDVLEVGDTFTVTVADKILEYTVDRISVVSPDRLEEVRQIPGRDLVTLITCTPRFINSERLLVRGERTGTAVVGAAEGEISGRVPPDPGLPWWILLAVGPALLAAAGAISLERRRADSGVVTTEGR